ncbi:hypothetical protein D3C72_2419750 [compost metagenome]
MFRKGQLASWIQHNNALHLTALQAGVRLSRTAEWEHAANGRLNFPLLDSISKKE